VLIEKPMALQSKHVEELLNLAQSKQVGLYEGLWMTSMPLFQNIVQNVQDKAIGDLKLLESSFS